MAVGGVRLVLSYSLAFAAGVAAFVAASYLWLDRRFDLR
jgi:hypothetical protein